MAPVKHAGWHMNTIYYISYVLMFNPVLQT